MQNHNGASQIGLSALFDTYTSPSTPIAWLSSLSHGPAAQRVQADWPEVAAKPPAAHSEQTAEPAAAAEPGMHTWQSAADTEPLFELAEPDSRRATTVSERSETRAVSRKGLGLSRPPALRARFSALPLRTCSAESADRFSRSG